MKDVWDNLADARRQAWSRYWRSGALHSCGGSFAGNYASAIGAFWHDAFCTLPPGSRVLDVGTGNGPLIQLLLDTRPVGDGIEADGIDVADIAPAWPTALPDDGRRRVRFHPCTAAETLPFEPASFDLVMSQFGIEYSDLPRALGECQRVLRPSGRLRLVLHHSAGRPATLARDELTHVDWLLAPGSWLDAAAAMIGPMAQSATAQGRAKLANDAAAHLARQRFDACLAAMQARISDSIAPDILTDVNHWHAQVFRLSAQEGASVALAASKTIRRALEDNRERLNDLVAHALSPQGMTALRERLLTLGRNAEVAPLFTDGHLMGWALCA